MSDPTLDNTLTKLQSFIFKLSEIKLPKVDQTYFGFAAHEISGIQSIDEINKQFIDQFSLAVLGSNENKKIQPLEPFSIDSATLWISKTIEVNRRSIRLVFFPYTYWESTDEKLAEQKKKKKQADEKKEAEQMQKEQAGKSAEQIQKKKQAYEKKKAEQIKKELMAEAKKSTEQYQKMVKLFYLFNAFLKPYLTKEKTLISLSYLPPSQPGLRGKIIPLKLKAHIENVLQDLKKSFKLDISEIILQIIYVVCIEAKRQTIMFDGDVTNFKNVYVLTNETQSHPVFALKAVQKSYELEDRPVDLLKIGNSVKTAELHKHFHYNEFTRVKHNAEMKTCLDIKISNQLYAIFPAVLHPIHKVKQIIYNHYKFKDIQSKGSNIPLAYPKDQSWICQNQIDTDFYTINKIFNFINWNNRENQPRDDLYDFHLKSEGERLTIFNSMIALNTQFLDQQPYFIHALIMTQINLLLKQLEELVLALQSESDLPKKYLIEKRILEFSKILLRLLDSLKKNPFFSHLLKNFEAKFYEHLLEIYTEAYDEFCRANKQIYGKFFNLITKVRQLQSVETQILKVLKNQSKNARWQPYLINSVQEAKLRQKKLQIEMNMLQENSTNDQDREIKRKIFVVKYELALTHKRIAMEIDFGNGNSLYLKKALQIVFVDLYKYLFVDSNNFTTEYPNGIGFDDDVLLKEASGLLKLMGRIDFSIEIQKFMGRHKKVCEYYKQWLMRYRCENLKDLPKMREIIQKAITYFKAKDHISYVREFYDILNETCMTKKERDVFEDERVSFEKEMIDPVKRTNINNAVKTKLFPLVERNIKDTVREISQLCVIPDDKQRINSLLFAE